MATSPAARGRIASSWRLRKLSFDRHGITLNFGIHDDRAQMSHDQGKNSVKKLFQHSR
jgi:predicted subunit of tRNA(5-methylaminomethyl-2-thiouridylate) methyltransferase